MSVADPNNYGDEPQVIELLFPEKFTFRGLDQGDFNELRCKNDIKAIFKSVGIEYGKGKFEGVYMRAQEKVNSYFPYLIILVSNWQKSICQCLFISRKRNALLTLMMINYSQDFYKITEILKL